MLCSGAILNQSQYEITQRVMVLEDKELAWEAFGLPFEAEDWLRAFQVDSRLLSACYQSRHPDFDFFIVVYDYVHFTSETEVMEAILFHEIGHFSHPVWAGEINIEHEILCDTLAVKKGYKNGIEKVLQQTEHLATILKSTLLQEITNKRLAALLSR